jgi:hypothetical protein
MPPRKKIFSRFQRFLLFLWIFVQVFGIIVLPQKAGAETESLYTSRGKRDPFLQLVTSSSRQATGLLGVESAEEISVEGVAYDEKKGSVVVANGNVLREGEEIGNVKVGKITPDGAFFMVNGAETFKPMYQEETKKEGEKK